MYLSCVIGVFIGWLESRSWLQRCSDYISCISKGSCCRRKQLTPTKPYITTSRAVMTAATFNLTNTRCWPPDNASIRTPCWQEHQRVHSIWCRMAQVYSRLCRPASSPSSSWASQVATVLSNSTRCYSITTKDKVGSWTSVMSTLSYQSIHTDSREKLTGCHRRWVL